MAALPFGYLLSAPIHKPSRRPWRRRRAGAARRRCCDVGLFPVLAHYCSISSNRAIEACSCAGRRENGEISAVSVPSCRLPLIPSQGARATSLLIPPPAAGRRPPLRNRRRGGSMTDGQDELVRARGRARPPHEHSGNACGCGQHTSTAAHLGVWHTTVPLLLHSSQQAAALSDLLLKMFDFAARFFSVAKCN
jgi:hypothetical protein